MKTNNEKGKFNIKELFTNKQYRAIAILVFYGILFTFLIVSIRVTSPGKINNIGNNVTKVEGYELIDNKNFAYKYEVIIDDETLYYDGKKYGDKDLVTITKNNEVREYFINNKTVFVKENDMYIKTLEEPYVLFNFLDTDILDELILRSIIIDSDSHKYSIDNQKIFDVVSSNTTKIDSGDNYIELTYRNDNITGIKFDFSNYSQVMMEDYDKVIISLNYYDFNLIDDFDIVISE